MAEEAETLIKKIEFLAKDMKQLIRAVPYTDRTYEKICNLTYNENQGGQLHYSLGHAGLGVAFSSGLGDRHLPCGRLEALPEQEQRKIIRRELPQSLERHEEVCTIENIQPTKSEEGVATCAI